MDQVEKKTAKDNKKMYSELNQISNPSPKTVGKKT
jgi:hypothetical protein